MDLSFARKCASDAFGSRLCEKSSRRTSRETLTSQIGPGSTIATSARVERPPKLRYDRLSTQPRSRGGPRWCDCAVMKLPIAWALRVTDGRRKSSNNEAAWSRGEHHSVCTVHQGTPRPVGPPCFFFGIFAGSNAGKSRTGLAVATLPRLICDLTVTPPLPGLRRRP